MSNGGLRRRALALGVGIGATGVFLLVAELAFLALNRFSDDGIESDEPYLYAFSESMGYVPLPNAEGRAFKKWNDKTLFDVTYRTDNAGRRLTPSPDCTSPEEFVAFLGGSFVFGHGLEDTETLPAQVQSLVPGVRAYNYGFSGYGPQQALVKARSGELQDEMDESSGTVVYVFMGHHVHRAIGSMRVWTQWGRHFPCFALTGNGQLEHLGSFVQGRPIRSAVYDLLKREQFLKFFDIDIPAAITAGHLDLTAEILRQTALAVGETWPDGRFIVLMYPASPSVQFDRSRFIELLRQRDLEVLDLSALINMTEDNFHFPQDGHPTAAAHDIVANALATYLRDDE